MAGRALVLVAPDGTVRVDTFAPPLEVPGPELVLDALDERRRRLASATAGSSVADPLLAFGAFATERTKAMPPTGGGRKEHMTDGVSRVSLEIGGT